jgi:hypothetical protein
MKALRPVSIANMMRRIAKTIDAVFRCLLKRNRAAENNAAPQKAK